MTTDVSPQGPGGGVTSAALDALLGSTRGSVAIRGASGWTVLPPSGAGKILKDGGSGADPSWAALSALIDAALGSTRGQVLYRGASGWSALSPGTSGQVLQTGGAGADPSWATAGGGEKGSTSNHGTFMGSDTDFTNTSYSDWASISSAGLTGKSTAYLWGVVVCKILTDTHYAQVKLTGASDEDSRVTLCEYRGTAAANEFVCLPLGGSVACSAGHGFSFGFSFLSENANGIKVINSLTRIGWLIVPRD